MLYITIQGKQVFLSLKASNYNHFKLQETLIQATFCDWRKFCARAIQNELAGHMFWDP